MASLPSIEIMGALHLGIDDEDFGICMVPAIEQSFGIHFEQNDFEQVRTYGELCTVVQSKLALADAIDCTSQQAFYKLRKAMQTHAGAGPIHPATLLRDVLPSNWAQRRNAVRAIEQALGMKLNMLDAPYLVQNICIGLLCLSILGLPIAAIVGAIWGTGIGFMVCLVCFISALVGMQIGSHLGAATQYATVGEIANVMSSRFYLQSRRNSNTINKDEILRSLNALFSDLSGINPEELTPDAILI